MQKRITLFLNHFPYPADHGAKVDIWRRIIVMHTLGYRLQIICWSGNTLSAENRQKVEAICDQLIIIPIYKSFWKRCKKAFLSLFFSLYPASISTHTDYKELKRIIRDFNPDILWLETFAPGLPALKMAKLLSIPLIYRSHNIEHHYAKEITDSIPNPQIRERVTRWFMSYQLENFEKKLVQKSQTVFDISIDDLHFWKNLYPQKNIVWLPPLLETTSLTKPSSTQDKIIDFLFIGNLFTKNNILALKWMINEVMPLVLKKLPNTLFHIVGSNPSAEFLSYLRSFRYIKVSIDVENIEDFLGKSKVIVNPALRGSGITIKTIDGLQSKSIWVGTRQAFQGLPNDFYEVLHPANNAQELAEQMIYFYTYPDQYPYNKVSTLCNQYFDTLPKQILSGIFSHLS